MKKFLFVTIFLAFLGGGIFLLSQKQKAPTTTLTVAAAANLTQSFSEIGQEFTKETGIPIDFVFGATGQLNQQIKNGAPVDLFAAADTKTIIGLGEEALIDQETISNYAQGNVVFVPYLEKDFVPQALEDLTREEVKIIALANPETAPYGQAAQELLIGAGIWEEISDKVVYGKTVDDVLNYVKTGNADAAFVAKSLVFQSDIKYYEEAGWLEMYQPIVQNLGVVSSSSQKEAALKLSQFILGEKGQTILRDFGYSLP